MKDFRFIVKVDHSDPTASLQKLGELVCANSEAFTEVDLEFIRNQDFIVTVPVEMSLTSEMRAHLLYKCPEVRFVVTGVPANRVSNLRELGFRVRDAVSDSDEEEVQKEEKKELEKKEDSKELEKKEEKKELEKKEEKKEVVEKFYLNGKEVDKETFEKEVGDVAKEGRAFLEKMNFSFPFWF